jgi:heptosyltransferase-1
MPRILIIKTSSMGDVIHALPALTDLARHYPEATVDWLVEAPFAPLPALHPMLHGTIPIAWRRWRKSLWRQDTRHELRATCDRLALGGYDLAVDLQGLVKSAMWGLALSDTARIGYDRHSIREPLASWFYHSRYTVTRTAHAIQRNRILLGRALGYTPDDTVDYGITPPAQRPDGLPQQPYVVLLHATSRADKEWPEPCWVALGQHLAARGLATVLPWGNAREHARAERLARQWPGAWVPPALALDAASRLLADARAVVGVDTGLTHLAAATGTPTLALYCASDPGLTGVLASTPYGNLGGPGQCPDVSAVQNAIAPWLDT